MAVHIGEQRMAGLLFKLRLESVGISTSTCVQVPVFNTKLQYKTMSGFRLTHEFSTKVDT